MDNHSLDIELNRLDDECRQQPSRYMEAAEGLAKARRTLEKAKAWLDVTRAEIDKEIRENPEKFGITKMTETVITNAILLDPRYDKEVQYIIECKHEVDVHLATVTALDHRKKSLENLVFLHGQSYFASPKNSEEAVNKEGGDRKKDRRRVRREQ